MTGKELKAKILAYIDREQEGLMDSNGNFEYAEHEGAYHALCNLEAFINSLSEELVNIENIKYKFRAKELKTENLVEGDLVHVNQVIFRKDKGVEYREKPMIVKLNSHGGMMYATSRYYINENTIELIKEN